MLKYFILITFKRCSWNSPYHMMKEPFRDEKVNDIRVVSRSMKGERKVKGSRDLHQLRAKNSTWCTKISMVYRWLMRCFLICVRPFHVWSYKDSVDYLIPHAFIFALFCFSKYIHINLALMVESSCKKFNMINAIWLIFLLVAAPTVNFSLFSIASFWNFPVFFPVL